MSIPETGIQRSHSNGQVIIQIVQKIPEGESPNLGLKDPLVINGATFSSLKDLPIMRMVDGRLISNGDQMIPRKLGTVAIPSSMSSYGSSTVHQGSSYNPRVQVNPVNGHHQPRIMKRVSSATQSNTNRAVHQTKPLPSTENLPDRWRRPQSFGRDPLSAIDSDRITGTISCPALIEKVDHPPIPKRSTQDYPLVTKSPSVGTTRISFRSPNPPGRPRGLPNGASDLQPLSLPTNPLRVPVSPKCGRTSAMSERERAILYDHGILTEPPRKMDRPTNPSFDSSRSGFVDLTTGTVYSRNTSSSGAQSTSNGTNGKFSFINILKKSNGLPGPSFIQGSDPLSRAPTFSTGPTPRRSPPKKKRRSSPLPAYDCTSARTRGSFKDPFPAHKNEWLFPKYYDGTSARTRGYKPSDSKRNDSGKQPTLDPKFKFLQPFKPSAVKRSRKQNFLPDKKSTIFSTIDETLDAVLKNPELDKEFDFSVQVQAPSPPETKPDPKKKEEWRERQRQLKLSKAETCARIRPISGAFVCARCRPFDGLRRETNWFYFMMHPERNTNYRPKRRRFGEDVPVTEKSGKSYMVTGEMPLAVQYRAFCRNPTSLYLSKSKIHGIGVYSDEELPTGRLVLDYLGELIRISLVDKRESEYRKKGFGSYMFVLDNDYAVDATKTGGIARFINHSCDPNCSAKVISLGDCKRIVLFAARHIEKNEELSYNYKLPLEDEKIPCVCGASNCKKTLN